MVFQKAAPATAEAAARKPSTGTLPTIQMTTTMSNDKSNILVKMEIF